MGNKQSPLTTKTKRAINYGDDKARFRAVSEEVEGKAIRQLRGYAILFGVFGKPRRGSVWTEKVDKDALVGVDLSKLVLLLDHNTTWVLGKVGKNMRAVVDETGLFIEVTLGNTWIDDYVYDRVSQEILDGMSFYFDSKAVIASDWDTKIDVIVKINEIYEVSVLAFPAYEDTLIMADEPETDPPALDTAVDAALKQALTNLIDQM